MAFRVSRLALIAVALASAFMNGETQNFPDDGNDKDLNPVEWQGGLVAVPGSNQRIPCGLATRAQIFNNTAFVCAPRLKPHIPFTLMKLELNTLPHIENVLQPFPPRFGQREGACDDLQSVVDIFLDHQDILWALDNGALNAFHTEPVQACFPKVVAIDVTTGKVLKVIHLTDMVTPESRLQFMVVDYSADGKPFVYITDAGNNSIIVCDVETSNYFRIRLSKEVIPENVPKDVLYMVLAKRPDGKNLIYFSYRSSDKLYCIETASIQKDASSAKTYEVGVKTFPIIILGTDDWDAMYFRREDKSDIYKWSTTNPFTEKNFLLVHKASGDLIPTQTMADYKNGVMRCLTGNLIEYLRSGAKPTDAKNCLAVLAITADST